MSILWLKWPAIIIGGWFGVACFTGLVLGAGISYGRRGDDEMRLKGRIARACPSMTWNRPQTPTRANVPSGSVTETARSAADLVDSDAGERGS